jgi:aryl-alcohol dehydrogenase-like predicted oxidoreductase
MRYATKEGTFGYLKRFKDHSRDFYRYDGERFVSSLGLGTFRKEPYREENYTISYKDAVKMALLGGINLIDTAINYRYQMSEREIGEALGELFASGMLRRDEVVLTSKAGFLPLDFPFPANPYVWIEEQIVAKNLAAKEDIVADQHAMTPEFLRWSLERSLENLGVETIDIFFLHNPEFQLGYISYESLKERIKEAFEIFETFVKEGKIRCYGIASWNGFLYEPNHTEFISLADTVAIAEEVGGANHRFSYVQTPYNLVKTDALVYPNQKNKEGKIVPFMTAAESFGLKMMGSSSLLQMNLFKGKFHEKVGALLGTDGLSDVLSALQFARSANVMSALVGAADAAHVEHNLLLAKVPNPKPHNLKQLFGGSDAV